MPLENWILEIGLVVLVGAAFIDYWIGDPWNWLHPVQVMGWVIQRYGQFVLKTWQNPAVLRGAGLLLAIALPLLSAGAGWLIVEQSTRWHPLLGLAVQCVLLASCFAGRSLRQAAIAVLTPLRLGDLSKARSQLSLYVGRDTDQLSESEVLRAVLETVTENATDGVMAPLFYAILGAFLPCSSVPLALAYKAVSTLDSMVGYREPPFKDLGWASARLDDVLTWVPCRLHVLTLTLLLSGRPAEVWQICCRDAPQDKSPNSGWSECVYAAILGVQMGGLNHYRGVVKYKPVVGDRVQAITPAIVDQALGLTRKSFLIWLSLAAILLMALHAL
ncbi:MAG: adenosylcobinamide-phosphate synthase CbiB [Oculatellaceae cyanobacterium Prado106]|nr:adenosylcobinamide-phosphate synthase CbiB [Oculatellaceae cyanobacterium Prado106]